MVQGLDVHRADSISRSNNRSLATMLQACADKLENEIRDFGNPPVFPTEDAKIDEAPAV